MTECPCVSDGAVCPLDDVQISYSLRATRLRPAVVEELPREAPPWPETPAAELLLNAGLAARHRWFVKKTRFDERLSEVYVLLVPAWAWEMWPVSQSEARFGSWPRFRSACKSLAGLAASDRDSREALAWLLPFVLNSDSWHGWSTPGGDGVVAAIAERLEDVGADLRLGTVPA